MRIAKGIKGIRKIINDDKVGWHVTGKEKYIDYIELNFTALLGHDDFRDATIIGIGGNVICLDRD